MKVLQVTFTYPNGSNAKIVRLLHEGLLRCGIISHICYGRGVSIKSPDILKFASNAECLIHSIQSRLFGIDFGYSYYSTNKLLDIINKEKYDIVHIHGVTGHYVNAYKLLDYLKTHHIPTMVTMHSENMYTAGCEHAYNCTKWKSQCQDCKRIKGIISHLYRDDAKYCFNLIKSCYNGFPITVVGVSEWLTERAKRSAVFDGSMASFETIHNGVDTNVFTVYDVSSERKQYFREGTDKLIIHVTPDFSNPNKGGNYILNIARKMSTCTFIIIGPNVPNDCPSNVYAIGPVYNESELAKLYNIADATILTSKRETFSLVCAESLCCGTPVVGFKSGGPESIFTLDYASFCDYDDVSGLEELLNSALCRPLDRTYLSKVAHSRYSETVMFNKYLHLYKRITS